MLVIADPTLHVAVQWLASLHRIMPKDQRARGYEADAGGVDVAVSERVATGEIPIYVYTAAKEALRWLCPNQ